jgi:hypothetical protein
MKTTTNSYHNKKITIIWIITQDFKFIQLYLQCFDSDLVGPAYHEIAYGFGSSSEKNVSPH